MHLLYRIVCFIIGGLKLVEDFICWLMPNLIRNYVTKLLRDKDILINGGRKWDIQVNNDNFYRRIAVYATLGFGESYMEGWWDCEDLEQLSFRIYSRDAFKLPFKFAHNRLFMYLLSEVFNLQTQALCWDVGKKHYNLGNDFFASFLDPTMNYSCGYWKTAANLEEAQLDKMELIAQKLKLKPGMNVLDIGCGWGSLAKYLSLNYGVSVVACTVSSEQVKYAKKSCKGLMVDIRLVDYRDINEKFDRIVSVGMFEHVGIKNYRTFFEVAERCLVDDGILLLHTIGINHTKMPFTEPWTNRYIFTVGMIPYYKHITQFSEGLFVLEDWQNFGYYYHLTLKAWYKKFIQNWHRFASNDQLDDTFFRMWSFYLQFASGAFKARRFNVWQVVFSKNGLEGGYEAIR